MTRINVYDVEAELIEKVADANDTTSAEVVEVLCGYIEEAKKDNGWK